MKASPTRIRAVQLDLARQKESLTAIGDFLTFAAEWGYNTLFLYLEGVVRTNSFPHPPKESSYSEEELRQVLTMARSAKLDVIPGLATLGHAEHFLEHAHLSHLREGGSWSRNMFCPSQPGTYEFLESYLKEMATLFPSPHIHIGCDESWALGACPVCRQRLANGEKREDLFIQHITRTHRFLTGLGKRVWIWSDMLETFSPEALARIPRDIVLCEWHYKSECINHDGFLGHFNNLRRRDALSLHEQSGHDTVLCPISEWNDVVAISEVGRSRTLFGGLLTNWEMSNTFLPGILPVTALIGRMWEFPGEGTSEAFDAVCARVFANASKGERMVLRYSLCGNLWSASFAEVAHRGHLTEEEARYLFAAQANTEILKGYLARLPAGQEHDIVEEILSHVCLQVCLGLMRRAMRELAHPGISPVTRREAMDDFQTAMQDMEKLARLRNEQWERWREGIRPRKASLFLTELRESLNQFFSELIHARVEERGVLSLRLFLVEAYSAPRLTVEIHNGSAWTEIVSGTYKPVNFRDASYAVDIPLIWTHDDPQRIRIKVTGFGDQGIQFASLSINNRKWVPGHISCQQGRITNAEALLFDDAFVCFLGEKDTLKTLEEFSDNSESLVEIFLAEASAPANDISSQPVEEGQRKFSANRQAKPAGGTLF